MPLQMINAREAPLTYGAAKVLLGGLHICPSGRRMDQMRGNAREGSSEAEGGQMEREKEGLGAGEECKMIDSLMHWIRFRGLGIAGVFVPADGTRCPLPSTSDPP